MEIQIILLDIDTGRWGGQRWVDVLKIKINDWEASLLGVEWGDRFFVDLLWLPLVKP